MTKRVVRTAVVLFAVLVLVYFAFQVYMMAYPSYKTSVATVTGVASSFATTGIAVRDETLIEVAADGVLNFLVDDGEKVGTGARVAEVYATSDAAIENLRLSLLKKEYTLLKNTADAGRTAGTNIESMSNGLYDTLSALSGELSRGDFSAVTQRRSEILELLNSFYITAGKDLSLDARITSLEQRIAAIEAGDNEPTGYITTPLEGYFVSHADGYEALIDKQSVVQMTPDQLEALLAQETPQTGDSCRIINGYKWYFAFVADAAVADRFTVNDTMALDFTYSSAAATDAVVVAVVPGSDGSATIVLRCDVLNSEMATLRVEEATVTFKSYTGIRIDRTALHMEDGVTGVYVKYGSAVEFRKLDIVYETQDYVLSRAYTGSSEYVSLYDEIITQGRDLYVGKELGNG
ncbi:MAG: HlyD family efflux transporter periplasmic adaptor subunit [Oscillospiraceae bacterium]|nr:HlyD family efflux transporter periplasmic adaptor subunit [Oscillospiraceae bacterium]